MSEKNGIKNHFEDYLTKTDTASPCLEVLDPQYQAHLDRPDWWTYIDQDQDFDKGDDSPPF